MPPASPAATSALRMRSSSEVLPWSTWPSTVTTGGRAVIISGLSSSCSTVTSSPASLTTALKPNFLATAVATSLAMFWLIVAIVPILMSSEMTSLTGTIIDVASSCTVSKSGISIVSSSLGGSIGSESVFFLRERSLSSNSSFSRSFFAAALSSWLRARSPGRPPADGEGPSFALVRLGCGPDGRCPGAMGRNGPLPAGRRTGACIGASTLPATRGGVRGVRPPWPGIAWPGRGATPGR